MSAVLEAPDAGLCAFIIVKRLSSAQHETLPGLQAPELAPVPSWCNVDVLCALLIRTWFTR